MQQQTAYLVVELVNETPYPEHIYTIDTSGSPLNLNEPLYAFIDNLSLGWFLKQTSAGLVPFYWKTYKATEEGLWILIKSWKWGEPAVLNYKNKDGDSNESHT